MSATEEQQLSLQRFLTKYEISAKYGQSLHRLVDYHSVIVADDSASMASLANPDDSINNPDVTRWQELKTSMHIILEAHQALGISTNVYFVNRGIVRNVRSFEQLASVLFAPPTGTSHLCETLQQVQNEWMQESILEEKGLIIHILTDGHATVKKGEEKEDIPSFIHWIRDRPFASKVNISLLLCSNEVDTDVVYKLLNDHSSLANRFQYRLRQISARITASSSAKESEESYHEANDKEEEIASSMNSEEHDAHHAPWQTPRDNVDVTLDFRGEIKQVWKLHGRHVHFNYGDYVAKLLIGSVDDALHRVDESRRRRLSRVFSSDLPLHPLANNAHEHHHNNNNNNNNDNNNDNNQGWKTGGEGKEEEAGKDRCVIV